CHAILHGVKGWLNSDEETRALTESLGDILAMFSAGRHKEARIHALKECQGSFSNKSNILSKFGEIPGTNLFLRDGSQKTVLSEVDRKPYPLSKVLTSALYEAFSTYLEEISGSNAVQDDILVSLTELTRAVFSSIASLPNESVSLNHFALEIVRQSSPAFSLHLKKSLKDRGFNLSSGVGEDIIAAMSPIEFDNDQSFKEAHKKLLLEACGATPLLNNSIEIKPKNRKNFPTKKRTCLNLDILENDFKIGTACLTLNHQNEPVSIYYSRFQGE
ncbi:MAG: hypothetical protein KAS32_31180, partial [Candidatus Peribacteraceae bacterium]|nr:hypothetical protein [Candidatus Peribacteraceae bacterium]